MQTDFCIVFCTVPNQEVAEHIATHVLNHRLAACVNIVPGLQSLYIWENELRRGDELLMKMKTHQSKLNELEREIVKVHPYEFPEFIVSPIMYGNQNYLDWVSSVVS